MKTKRTILLTLISLLTLYINVRAQKLDEEKIDFSSAQQNSDSLNGKNTDFKQIIKKSIIPISLIVLGAGLSNSKFEKELSTNLSGSIIDDFSLPIDNLMQYVPIAEIYIADVIGVKAKNHWFDQTKYLAIANIITSGLTHAGKSIINKRRPDGSSASFPSGHTSFSFTNSAVLYEEFKDTAPILAYSGYFLSTTVGGLRIVNNKHWLSDVLAGAGLGILVTKLVYHFEPLKNWNPFKKSKNLMVIPEISRSNVGLYASYKF